MSGAGRKSGGGRRTVTDDEAELWEHATRSLEPVKAKPRVAPACSTPKLSPSGWRRRPAAGVSDARAQAEPDRRYPGSSRAQRRQG